MENRLTLVKELDERSKDGKKLGLYKCICGNEVKRAITRVNHNKVRSCGCLITDVLIKRNTTHNMSYSNEFSIWADIIKRCTNSNYRWFKYYGGRGISVSEEWKSNFMCFYKDMGPRPTKKHTVHRKNNNGNYCKENCVWVTGNEQNQHRRNSRWITFQGETLVVAEWARRLGVNKRRLYKRLDNNWTVEETLTIPFSLHNKKHLKDNKSDSKY